MSRPLPSSSQASMVSISSSHDPAGGLHLSDVAGGADSLGCVPFLLERFVLAACAVLVVRLRFLPLAASCVCSNIFSRPPIDSR